MNDIEKVKSLYSQVTGEFPGCIAEIKGSGSTRRYFRLGPSPVFIATVGKDRAENDSFLYLTQHFRALGLPVPEVLAVSDDRLAYIPVTYSQIR
ncbi:MAG: hypothetical protein K2H98_08590, partial [Duncaniella sp.]|nr:hypothetical protein [Duncaniella sp.]